MKQKIALITGITGQDGSYLAEFLLKKKYVVHGVKRRTSLLNTDRIDHLYQDPHVDNRNFLLHYGDMTDSSSLLHIIQKVKPDEIYNLAAQSHVAVSFEEPEYTANSDALGALRILEAIRILDLQKNTRFYQASTSELYGLVQEIPQKEEESILGNISMENASYFESKEETEQSSDGEDLPEFELESIEQVTPALFSEDETVNLANNNKETQFEEKQEESNPSLFDDIVSQEENYEIPAFLRRQKN